MKILVSITLFFAYSSSFAMDFNILYSCKTQLDHYEKDWKTVDKGGAFKVPAGGMTTLVRTVNGKDYEYAMQIAFGNPIDDSKIKDLEFLFAPWVSPAGYTSELAKNNAPRATVSPSPIIILSVQTFSVREVRGTITAPKSFSMRSYVPDPDSSGRRITDILTIICDLI